MRKWLLAGASALALSVAAGGAAHATVFSYTGAVASFTVATSGEYQIVAAGAQGGKSNDAVGGDGARLGGDTYLAAGTTLNVVVGQAGAYNQGPGASGGGGGGSFVYGSTLLVAAGGGGGAGHTYNGGAAQTGASGGAGRSVNGNFAGAGGTAGAGGAGGTYTVGAANHGYNGGGGAGWKGNGIPGAGLYSGNSGSAPAVFIGGANSGGGYGGFGGGGGAGQAGGGGGGGYSGGGGGGGSHGPANNQPDASGGGGGGGSFLAASFSNDLTPTATQTGNGYVSITAVSSPVPEPAAAGLLATALTALGLARRRRRN